MPTAASRGVGATNTDMMLMLVQDGVHELGEVTSGIAQGCPLAGLLFVSAMGPVGRHLHSAFREARGGRARQCADDIAVVLRAARFLSVLAPIFRDADKDAGLHLKLAKCEVVLVGRDRGDTARAIAEAELARADPEWRNFRVGEAGKY